MIKPLRNSYCVELTDVNFLSASSEALNEEQQVFIRQIKVENVCNVALSG